MDLLSYSLSYMPSVSASSERYRIGEAARYLKMSIVGVRLAADQGRLPCFTTASGQRIFLRSDLDAYLGLPMAVDVPKPRVEALYCRISGSGAQVSSLVNQEAALRESATGTISKVYTDQASGLNERRKGLTALLDDAAEGKFTVVRVTHKDRLARFGVAYLERCLALSGVSVEVLHEKGNGSLHEELMADFMSLVASFSGRFYNMRSRTNQAKLLLNAQEQLNSTEGVE